jgi:UDP-N-acetylmuramate dehydrogenase
VSLLASHRPFQSVVQREALEELKGRLGAGCRLDESLARYTSLRVGGIADAFFLAREARSAVEAIEHATDLRLAWRVLGGGSNLLVADEGVEGLVLKIGTQDVAIEAIDAERANVMADAGCSLSALARRLAMAGYAGLEWSASVPGSVGAAVVNNSGAFGSCIAEHLAMARVYVPEEGVHQLTVAGLDLQYRSSRLKRGDIRGLVLSATFEVRREPSPHLMTRIREIQQVRRSTQPAGSSVGSIFANPPGLYAGRLIEQCRLKGSRIGGAEVSALHANFILNQGNASSADVLALVQRMQQEVWARTGVWLVPEFQLLGRFPEGTITSLIESPHA